MAQDMTYGVCRGKTVYQFSVSSFSTFIIYHLLSSIFKVSTLSFTTKDVKPGPKMPLGEVTNLSVNHYNEMYFSVQCLKVIRCMLPCNG